MDGIAWNRRWRPVWDDAEATSLQLALRKEISAAHPLFALNVQVIGRCTGSDDVVVTLGDGRVGVVHLTWQGRPDQFPDKYPGWGAYPTVSAFNDAIALDPDDDDDL